LREIKAPIKLRGKQTMERNYTVIRHFNNKSVFENETRKRRPLKCMPFVAIISGGKQMSFFTKEAK
jgi:hypothetical protein